jgi:diphthine-ammonia ligase
MAEETSQDRPAKVAVLWTGGKDSCLAMHEASQQGYEIDRLVTFVPPEGRFRAHPLEVMQLQAQALGLPHHTMEIGEPYGPAYQEAIASLGERWGIRTLVTGDMGEVDGHPNWIEECASSSGMRVFMPLWGRNDTGLLDHFISSGFRAIVSCVRNPWLIEGWLGRELDAEALAELSTLAERHGFDVCGEQGEYHTLVLDGPLFTKRISIDGFETKTEDNLSYIEIEKASLRAKRRRTPPAHGIDGEGTP